MELELSEIFIKSKLGDILEDEYLIDGLPYCKKCKTKRYFYWKEENGKGYLFKSLCKCQEVDREKEAVEKLKLKRIEEFKNRQKFSNIGNRYLDVRFENSKITNSNKYIYQKCQNYVKNAKDMILNNFGIYVFGDNSSGKTHLTACMCNFLIENGYSCLYTNMPKILAEIQASYSNDGDYGQAKIIEIIANKSFVFIDDLGKEFLGREFNSSASKFAEKILLEVLNARYNNKLPTIFSSNYSIQEIAQVFKLDKAIIERINEMSTRIFNLEGDDFREQELKRKRELLKSFGI